RRSTGMPSPHLPFTLLLLLAAAGCGEPPVTSEPVRQLALVDGANQLGVPGEPLPRPVVVQLLGPDQVPLPGAPVTFVVADGGGHVVDASPLTDATGRASATWILGDESFLQHLTVS